MPKTRSRSCPQWQDRWATLMAKLGLPDDATSAQANASLTTLNQMFEQRNSRDEEAIRVRDMREFQFRNLRSVWERLLNLLSGTRGICHPRSLVNQLHAELTNAKEADNKLRALQKDHEAQEQALEEISREIQTHQMDLAQMCKQAGCEIPTNFRRRKKIPLAGCNWNKIKARPARIFCGSPAMLPSTSFSKKPTPKTPMLWTGSCPICDRQIEDVEQQLTRQIERTVSEENLLDSKSGGSQAASPPRKNKPSSPTLASIWNATSNCDWRGTCSGKRRSVTAKNIKGQCWGGPASYSESSPAARSSGCKTTATTRANPGWSACERINGIEESIELKGMSDGTADQLYLALRIASLEDWLDHHPPMPFIVDDVLINFDDQRAIAAL